ncbi:MAG: thioredoxin fold domain-containing protein [Chitinophagales bacterium]
MLKNYFVFSLFLSIAAICSSFTFVNNNETNSETNDSQKINWLSIEDAFELQQKNPKLILVDVYMNNCPYCTKMDKTTLEHPKVKEYIAENFYAVKLNAFTSQKITLGEKEYKVDKKSQYRTHELASYLLRGNMQFPSTVFIDENFKPINSVGGYLDAPEFDQILQYYGQGFYKKVPWGIYMRNSKPRFSK